MSDLPISSIIRRIIEVSVGLWTTVVFQGITLGSAILFFKFFFSPYLTIHFGDVINLNVPHWLYFMLGIAIILIMKAVLRRPLLRDNHREQLEAVEAIVRKLPKMEQTQVYRMLARKLVDGFHVDSDIKIDLISESNKIIDENFVFKDNK